MESMGGASGRSFGTWLAMAVICVECGQQGEQELFKRYTGGAIQLMQCVSLRYNYVWSGRILDNSISKVKQLKSYYIKTVFCPTGELPQSDRQVC